MVYKVNKPKPIKIILISKINSVTKLKINSLKKHFIAIMLR